MGLLLAVWSGTWTTAWGLGGQKQVKEKPSVLSRSQGKEATQSDESAPIGVPASAFPASMQLAAKAVRASTVTIRVDRYGPSDAAAPRKAAGGGSDLGSTTGPATGTPESQPQKNKRSVAVFSGVLVKQGFVAAPLFLPHPKKSEVRITLPNGEQTIGRPRILDEYSGLAIISIKDHTIPCLKCCSSSDPVVGDWVVSGAAWGRQEALVSLGMISGIGYRFPNSTIEPPPMIVCDLRAAQTSKGAGVVSANGKLIGVVMAVSNDRKWTYVVPASHIHRLLRSLALHENSSESEAGDIYVLKRQVPRLGVRVDNISKDKELGLYEVVVESVATNGAADQAGLRKGDRIKSVNGKAVRAWYDIVRDCLNRQPGDTIKLVIVRDEKEIEMPLILGGGFAASAKSMAKLRDYIHPEIDLENHSNSGLGQPTPSRRFNQLVNFSIQNLAPTPCDETEAYQELAESLKSERKKNSELRSRVELLESRLNRLIEKLDK